jgi:DUF4097 and DUF4098 domain-containing protein YvlB
MTWLRVTARIEFDLLSAWRDQMKLGYLAIGVLFLFVASACSDTFTGPTENRDDSFTVGDSPTVVVDGDNGGITINPGSDGTVRVEATLKKPEDLEYEIVQDGDSISIVAKDARSGRIHIGESPGADIVITAPSDTGLQIRASNGRVEISGMQRSGSVHTSNGRIVLTDVVGEFDLSTSNGGVTISRASGIFDVETSNGRIEFEGEMVPGGDNRMTTSNGSIEITLQGTASVELDASTSNGSVSSELPILMVSTGDEDHLKGTIGDGEATLFARTSNGSVTVE